MPDSLPAPGDPGDELFMQQILRHLDDALSDQETSELYAELLRSKKRRRQFVALHMRSVGLSELLRPQLAVDPEEPTPLTLDDAQILPALTASDEAAAAEAPADIAAHSSPELNVSGATSGSIWHNLVPSGNLRQHGVRWAAAAGVLIVFGIALLIILRQLGVLGTPTPQALAIGSSLDAVWANPAAAPASGTTLDNGVAQSLLSGYVELTSPNGLAVVIQGPANFTVPRAGVLSLHSGRLTAIVPRSARGFTVDTPVSSVVDLGTEFGVLVGPDGATDVEIFRGTVSVSPTTTVAGGSSDGLLITAGSARRVAPNGAVMEISANASAFVRPQQFEDWSAITAKTPYERWKAYSQRLCHDPDLVAYYTFDNADQAPDRLLNQSSFGSALDGVLGGNDPASRPIWTTGRWPEKGALQFGKVNVSRVVVPSGLGDPLDFSRGQRTASPLTIAAWIQPQGEGNAAIAAKGASFSEQFALDTGRAWIREAAGNPHELLRKPFTPPAASGVWSHVVFTYDPMQRNTRLYRNGVLINHGGAPAKLFQTDTPMTIGCRPDQQAGNSAKPVHFMAAFHGRIDELLIMRRAMSAGEVEEMYQIGKPD